MARYVHPQRRDTDVRGDLFRPAPRYSSTILDFVTKVKSTQPFEKKEDEYVFVAGLPKAKYLSPIIGQDVPEKWRTWNFLNYRNQGQSPNLQSSIPRFKCNRTRWGIDMRRIENEIIPYSIESVRKQQREMTPLMFWIKTHERSFKDKKPQICCNRFILRKIIACNESDGCFSFIAEKKDHTIYLREIHTPTDRRHQNNRSCGPLFESAILTGTDGQPESRFDLNESTYGIYLGTIGNIKILFSAEIDGFWKEDAPDPTKKQIIDMDDRVAEVKTIFYDMFSPHFADKFRSTMTDTWAQSFLVGVKKILFGITDRRKVAQLQTIELDEILELLKKRSEPPLATYFNKTCFTQRLHDTLSDIVEGVEEQNPIQYVVTTRYNSTYQRSTTDISNIYPLQFT